MIKKLVCLLFACCLIFSGCGKVVKSDKLKVVTTIFPPYDFAREIAGDRADVTMLLKPGGDIHSFEPTPQDIALISECDLFIYTGGDNDEWVENLLGSLDCVETIRMIDCVELIEEHDHSHESHDHGEADDHVWTSLLNAKLISEKICEKLSAKDSENTDFYVNNYKNFAQQLDKLDSEFLFCTESALRKKLVFADPFPARYFTERYGLDWVAAYPGCSGDTEANPKTVAELIEMVEDEKIPVVLHGELSDRKMADTVAEATGAEIRMFHSCHNLSKEDFQTGMSYIDIMKSNLDVLKEALY